MNKPTPPNFLQSIRVVLSRPSHPGNIGAAARAMKTMGLTQLYLVAPKVFPSEDARTRSSRAVDVLEQAVVVNTLQQALLDVTLACALTCRHRELAVPPSTPRQIAPELIQFARQGKQVALVFGNETFGLSADEVEQCNRLITIPGNQDYCSLNLAMAVQVITYELFSHIDVPMDGSQANLARATVYEVSSFCNHLEQAMQSSGYLTHRHNRARLMRRMRTLFHRSGLLREEIDILRGFFKQVEQQGRR